MSRRTPVPSVRRFSHVGKVIEADIHLGDMARAASLGLTPVQIYPNGAGYAKLSLNVGNRTPAQICTLINSKLNRNFADFDAVVTPQGLVALQTRMLPGDVEIIRPGSDTSYFFDGGEWTDFTPWRTIVNMQVQSSTFHPGGTGGYAFQSSNAIEGLRSAYSPLYATTGADGIATQGAFRCWYMQTDSPATWPWGICEPSSLLPLLRVDVATGKLELWMNSSTLDLGDTVLTNNVWHLIEMKVKPGTNPATQTTYEAKLDGNLECTLADVVVAPNVVGWYIGCTANAVVSQSQYWDDVYFGNDWVGTGQCSSVCLPLADTAVAGYDDWTASTGHKHDCVNEWPYSDTKYVFIAAYGEQLFTHDKGGAAYAGATSIKAIGYWARMAGNNVDTAGVCFRIIYQSPTESSSGSHAHTLFEWAHPMFRDADKDAAAWTEANVDALEIGGKSALVGPTVERQMSECYLFVDYVPAVAAGLIKKISGVDWANVKKVSSVAEASCKKVSGVVAN